MLSLEGGVQTGVLPPTARQKSPYTSTGPLSRVATALRAAFFPLD
jgi:hypothetical protein